MCDLVFVVVGGVDLEMLFFLLVGDEGCIVVIIVV